MLIQPRRPRISNPLSSIPDLRRWAANSLPRIIIVAIALHLVLCFMLVTELHRHQDYVRGFNLVPNHNNNNNNNNNARPRLHIRKDGIFRHDAKKYGQVNGTGQFSLEVDDLYVEHLQNINKALQQTLNISDSMSCRWRNRNNATGNSIFEEDCDHYYKIVSNATGSSINATRGRVALFNPLEQERILCDGTRIGPASILILEEGDLNCSEPPRLYQTVPTLETRDKIEPIALRFRMASLGGLATAKLPKFKQCDVPCRSDEPNGNVNTRTVEGTPFRLQHSMEGAQYYRTLRYLPTAHRHDTYYSTTSFESEIPLPYFSFDEYGGKIQAPGVNYSQAIKGAVFMARNCQSRNNREALVKSLIESDFLVESVSKCLHNAETNLTAKKDIMRNYLFYLAFENQSEKDYITEKLWETLQAGTVPVYFGAPNVEDHVPPHSIINANAFNTSHDLAEYLSRVASNQTLYERYHAWRTKPLPQSFITRYNMTRTHSTCRTCRWAAAKKYGLGWNHTTQTLEDLLIPRKVCHDSHGLTHPFQEVWLSGGRGKRSPLRLIKAEGRGTREECRTQATNFSAFIRFKNHVLRRRIRNQDGVIDLFLDAAKVLHEANESFILQMRTTINAKVDDPTSLKALSLKHYRFQDARSRMTILCSRRIEAQVSDTGILELHIPHAQQATKIRVIVEDIGPYPDSDKRANYFAQVMTEDFLNPLEKFVVWGSPKNESDWAKRSMNSIGVISPEEDEDEENTDDDLVRFEREEQERVRMEAEGMRQAMKILVKDETKVAAEKKVLDGIKKLIADGFIKIKDDDGDPQGADP